MATPAYEFEMAALPEFEFESEFESEWEGELEGEFESEQFFGALAGLARKAIQSPTLRRIGLAAAQKALGGLGSVGGAIGKHLGGASGGALGRDLGSTLGRHLSGWLPQREFESEFELEGEWEVNPQKRIYSDAMMEHFGHAAAAAESEAETEAFIGALIPLAAQLIPRVAPTIMRAAPQLIRGISGVAKTLGSSPTTRPLLRTLPTIVRGTAANIARQVAQGQPVSPQTAVRTLARQTARVVGNPQQSVQAYQRSRALDRRFHNLCRSGVSALGR
ncbi:MAG TPA: hypothetical protein VNN73_01115 [Blastocatellia bacterium]|nr:hypothetical protein [Blastocatellia bacterium]